MVKGHSSKRVAGGFGNSGEIFRHWPCAYQSHPNLWYDIPLLERAWKFVGCLEDDRKGANNIIEMSKTLIWLVFKGFEMGLAVLSDRKVLVRQVNTSINNFGEGKDTCIISRTIALAVIGAKLR